MCAWPVLRRFADRGVSTAVSIAAGRGTDAVQTCDDGATVPSYTDSSVTCLPCPPVDRVLGRMAEGACFACGVEQRWHGPGVRTATLTPGDPSRDMTGVDPCST